MDSADTKSSLYIRSYDVAYREFLHDAYNGFVASDPVIGGIRMERDRHAGPIRNVRTESPLDQPMESVGATMMLHREALRSTDVASHTEMVANFARELIGEQTKQFFRKMGEMCVAAGTSVKNVGQGVPTLVQLRELFKKMDLSFGEDGQIEGLTLFVDPIHTERAQALMLEAETDPECVAIVLEKRAEWMRDRASKSHRTLSR